MLLFFNYLISSSEISISDFDTLIVASPLNFILSKVSIPNFVCYKHKFYKCENYIKFYFEFVNKEDDPMLFLLTSSSLKESKLYILIKFLNPF